MALHLGLRGPGHLSRVFAAWAGLVIPGARVGQLVLNSPAKTGFTYLYGTM